MKPVIVFTTSNRLDYATRTLDSWRGVRGVDRARLLFQCEPDPPMVDLVSAKADFGVGTTIGVNTRWLGNEVNTYAALAAAFETGTDFVVCAEDDVLVAQDALEYFAWASAAYAADETVLTVSGFQNAVRGEPCEVFRRQWFTGCVWGMWPRSWEQVRDRWPGGPTPHSWDWYLCEVMKASGQVAVEPCVTRGQHIGVTGAHGSWPEHLAREWEAQKFSAEIGVQEYREVTAPHS